MACLIVNNQYVEYGSFVKFCYFVEGVKAPTSAKLRRAFTEKLQIQRREIKNIYGQREQYNHSEKTWEIVKFREE